MKMISAFVLALTMVFALSGCQRDAKEPSDKSGPIVNIVDLTETEEGPGIDLGMGPSAFWMENDTVYYFGETKVSVVIVYYKDGSHENIASALKAGRATIADLDKYGIVYYTREARDSDYKRWAGIGGTGAE